MNFRSRLALPVVFLVIAAWVSVFALPHDHDATGTHANCLTCRLADGAAGASPVLDAAPRVALTVESTAPAPPEERIAERIVTGIPQLRAPPIA